MEERRASANITACGIGKKPSKRRSFCRIPTKFGGRNAADAHLER